VCLIEMAEQKFGIAKAQENVMVINLGWGIGLGMIVNGEIFRGHNGFAGELSHIPLSDDDTLCDCGKRGCLETVASMKVVSEKAVEGIKSGRVTSLKTIDNTASKSLNDAILDAAENGDQFAIDLLSDAAYKIGKALAILIHIMNPQTIVLSDIAWASAMPGVLQKPIWHDKETKRRAVFVRFEPGAKLPPDTGHAGNQQLQELVAGNPAAMRGFQFSILQTLDRALAKPEVIAFESLHKTKLGSRAHGLNSN